MGNKLTFDSLADNMRVLLQTFNNEKVEITNDTIHNEVLSETDGFKTAPSSNKLYQGGVYWIIWGNGGKKTRFPNNWMDLSVKELAELIMSKQIV